jgi:thiol-disulfide isomerase/thioredoxin
MEKRKIYRIGGAVAVLLTVAAVSIGLSSSGNQVKKSSMDWKEVQLTDVDSGQEFSISSLDKPVLVENFAVWCPTCTKQQQQIKQMLENRDVDLTVVSMNTDPNENAEKIKQHASRNGFNWRYAVAPPEMSQLLVRKYGSSVLRPPLVPKILVCDNSTRRLDNGVKTPGKLVEEIEQGC